MNPDLEKKLFESYPLIFKQKDLPATETCMCWGICTGDGWYNILDILCTAIQQRIYRKSEMGETPMQVEATQVKSKWGGLRFYYEGGDEYIQGIVFFAESLSRITCEECGNQGLQNKKGWIKTLCQPCRENIDEIRKKRFQEVGKRLPLD